MRHPTRLLVSAALLAVSSTAIPLSTASAKSTGNCPPGQAGYELIDVSELGITPETATGIPSLDGNGDGLTCIKPLPNSDGNIIFRDNTVGR